MFFLFYTNTLNLEVMDSIICFKIINKKCISRSKSDERASIVPIVCECSIHLQFISCIRLQNMHIVPSLKLVDSVDRVALKQAWNERKDLIQLLEVCITDQYMRYSGCDI